MFTIVYILTVMTIKLIMLRPVGKICGNENNKPVFFGKVRIQDIRTK